MAVSALFKTKTAAEWAALLEGADCCFTRVISPAQLLDDMQMQARGMVGISDEGVPWMRSPIRLSDDAIDLQQAPAYGEHTREILSEIGYSDAEFDQMLADGIIRQAP